MLFRKLREGDVPGCVVLILPDHRTNTNKMMVYAMPGPCVPLVTTGLRKAANRLKELAEANPGHSVVSGLDLNSPCTAFIENMAGLGPPGPPSPDGLRRRDLRLEAAHATP